MAFGGLEPRQRNAPMADINMTPLIDVMLVLLVIFIITAPLMTHAIKLNLPSASASQSAVTPSTVTISVDAEGRFFWEQEAVDRVELKARLQRAAGDGAPETQPDIHLRADRTTQYQLIAELLSLAQQAGLAKVGFVTDQTR